MAIMERQVISPIFWLLLSFVAVIAFAKGDLLMGSSGLKPGGHVHGGAMESCCAVCVQS